MECPEAREQFSSLLDGELAPEDRTTLEKHLAGCSDCLRELDSLKKVEGLFRELPRHDAPVGFEARVREAVRPKVFRFARARVHRMPLWPMLSAAAAFVMVAGLVLWQVQYVAGPSRFQVAKTGVADNEAVSPLSEVLTEADLDVARPSGEQVDKVSGGAQGWGLPAEGQREELREQPIPEEQQTFADDSFMLEPGDTSTAYRAATPEIQDEPGARFPTPIDSELGAYSIEQERKGFGLAKSKPQVAAKTEGFVETTEQAEVADLLRRDVAAFEERSTMESRRERAAPEPSSTFAADNRAMVAPQQVPVIGYRKEAADAPAVHPSVPAEPMREADKKLTVVTTREVGERRFALQDGIWMEEGYRGQPTRILKKDSEAAQDLTRRYPFLADVLALGDRIVFSIEQIWYRVEPTG